MVEIKEITFTQVVTFYLFNLLNIIYINKTMKKIYNKANLKLIEK